ncbi:MAG: ABC transporter permease, partial [Williamsia herbipolensis]|nr:ABC transporter permease [Williamsia herbipolensis]
MSPVHRDQSADVATRVMRSLPRAGGAAGTDDAVPPGFVAGRTLPLKVELARQLRRRRTQLALGFMVLLPIILAVAFAFDEPADGGTSFVDLAQSSATNFAIVALFFSATFLLVVVISLFFGDT